MELYFVEYGSMVGSYRAIIRASSEEQAKKLFCNHFEGEVSKVYTKTKKLSKEGKPNVIIADYDRE